jgi:hypothetical protein
VGAKWGWIGEDREADGRVTKAHATCLGQRNRAYAMSRWGVMISILTRQRIRKARVSCIRHPAKDHAKGHAL